MLDLLLKNATIVDGTGAAAVRGALAVQAGRIADVGRLEGATAREVIDAAGRVVCPGFIDVHVHSELALLAGAHVAGVQMGVTTELICPDGMGFAFLPAEMLAGYRRYLYPIYGGDLPGQVWPTFAGYLGAFTGRLPNNIAAQAPHGAIRLAVMGWDARPAGDSELRDMERLVRECMEAGAVGLNAGLIYAPAQHADLRELTALATVSAAYGGVYAAHMRSYKDGERQAALAEMAAVGRAAGTAVHVSHFAGRADTYEPALAAQRADVDITWDAYPYTASCTLLATVLPHWALPGAPDQMLAALRDPAWRQKLAGPLEQALPPAALPYFAYLKLPQNKRLEGAPVRQAAEQAGQSLVDFVCDLLIEEDLAPLLIFPWPDSTQRNEERLRHTLTHPLQMVGSDGIYMGGRAHPRGWGSYPRILGRYVREERWLSLEDALRRMTSFPAQRFGLRDRGLIERGRAADLVVFDPQTVLDGATFETPQRPPRGIEHVFVNGVAVVRAGKLTGARPGQVLRRQGER